LLEDPSPDTFNHVLLAARLHDHRLDPLECKETTEHEAGRAGSDNANLRA
jgi:hypothetical protein